MQTNWLELMIMKTPNTEGKPNIITTLEKKMELIEALNETILAQVEEEDIEAEIADSSKFMDEIDI